MSRKYSTSPRNRRAAVTSSFPTGSSWLAFSIASNSCVRRASEPAESLGTQVSGTRPFEYAVPLSAEGVANVDVPELGLRFCLKAIDWSLAERDTRYEIGALDADCLRPPLVLRNWRPGDAVRLPGTHQVQKLKQLFVQERISLRERKTWPVLTSAGRIAWTRGWPPAADFSAGKGTRRGVVVLEEKL